MQVGINRYVKNIHKPISEQAYNSIQNSPQKSGSHNVALLHYLRGLAARRRRGVVLCLIEVLRFEEVRFSRTPHDLLAVARDGRPNLRRPVAGLVGSGLDGCGGGGGGGKWEVHHVEHAAQAPRHLRGSRRWVC